MFEFLDEETYAEVEKLTLTSGEFLSEIEKLKETFLASTETTFVVNSSPAIVIKTIKDRFHAGANDVYVLNGGDCDPPKFEVFNFTEVENLLLKAYIAGEFQTAPLGWFVTNLTDDQLKKLVV